MRIITSKLFDKKLGKLQKNTLKKIRERVSLFQKSPFDELLNNHALHGDRKPLRSINITGDMRIIYKQVDTNTVQFIDIDTHSNLY